MREINLSQNMVALVDDEDYEFLSQWKWHVFRHESGKYYAKRGEWDPDTKKVKTVFIHRIILNASSEVKVDHWDNDGLNNQRSNLRIVTTSQNGANVNKRPGNTSGYKGACWHKITKKYISKLKFRGKYIYLGYFDDPVQAAKMYDFWARDLFKEFAVLNFSGELVDG